MSGILIVRTDKPDHLIDAIIDEQCSAGFSVCLDRAGRHWRVIGFSPLLAHMPAAAFEDPEAGFALANGSFFYQGKHGLPALRLALEAWRQQRFDRNECAGQFTLVLGQDDDCEVIRDPLPSGHIYLNRQQTLFSTLLWPALQAEAVLTPDPQGIYEYAWLHANHGQLTPFQEISTLAPDRSLRFKADLAEQQTIASPAWLLPDLGNAGEDDIATHYADTLQAILDKPVSAFGDRIKAALSGGYDSRLVAAGLISCGSNADYYVYGSPTAPDRKVAEQVADKLSLHLDAIEKLAGMQFAGEAYRQHIDHKAVVFDGLYLEGLFDNGVDLVDREARLQDSDILISGSGGESLRNFFYLPNRKYEAGQIVDTFWTTLDPSACTAAFNPGDFRSRVSQQLAENIGVDIHQPMTRQQAELAYPLFRVRYWTTREIAVNQRFGWCYYPYLHQEIIKGSASIPLHWKNHGYMEGRIIRKLSPELAAIGSDYGFSFDGPIPWSYRLKIQTTYQRPTWLRRYSYRLRMRTRPPASWPDAEVLSYWIDPGCPRMSEFFHLERINDPEVFNRVATLEYLLARHQRFRQSLWAH